MDNTKLFNGIKDVIIDWLTPHIKRVARLGGHWGSDSYAGAFYWDCSNNSSATYADIGARLCNDGEISIWTSNSENVNIRIYYDTAISKPIVSHNTDSEHEDFSEDDIKNLYIKIKEYLEKNEEHGMPSPNEENSGNWWGRYIKERIVRTFDQSKFDIGKCYEVREINQTNPKLVFQCQCLLQSVYDTELVFLYLKEDGASSVFSINIQDIDNYVILEMFTTH